MEKLLQWIRNHKLLTIMIVAGIFFIPLLAIHMLFLWDSGIDWLIARWTPGDIMGYIAGFEAFIGTVSLGAVAFWQNQQIHNQHIESLEPILSMRLVLIDHIIYLLIENTGESGAKDIKITVDHIQNNGEVGLNLDALFQNTFELYPHEIVQGRVAMSGSNISTAIFPKIFVHVSYVRADINRKNEYSRSVIFDGGYSRKVIADVEMDNHKMESDTDCIARAVVRIANYLDGHQIAKFDEIDLLADRSLQNDLASAMSTANKVPIVSREESIRKRTRRKKNTKGEHND